jgi:uncharacterized integral membrane protein
MNMQKITQPKGLYVVGILVAIVVGIIIGKIWTDIPFIKFDGSVNVGVIISLLSLIGAIFIIPLVINRYFAKRNQVASTIQADLDEAIKRCETVSEQYRDIHFSKKNVTVNDQKLLRMRFRDISNILKMVTDNSKKLPEFSAFGKDVLEKFNESAYPDFTDTAITGQKITDDQFFKAVKSMSNITTKLRRYRYRI